MFGKEVFSNRRFMLVTLGLWLKCLYLYGMYIEVA